MTGHAAAGGRRLPRDQSGPHHAARHEEARRHPRQGGDASASNQIDSIEFGVEEPEALKDEARKLALKNVTDNAKLYAEAAGVGLGPILSISEEESSYQPRFAPAATRMEMAKDVPIEAGTASVEVRVRVSWEIN